MYFYFYAPKPNTDISTTYALVVVVDVKDEDGTVRDVMGEKVVDVEERVSGRGEVGDWGYSWLLRSLAKVVSDTTRAAIVYLESKSDAKYIFKSRTSLTSYT